MATITLAELYVHHTVDRDVFSRLAIDLRRDAPECLLVVALWLWLEDTTCSNVMTKIVGLSNSMLDALVNEAVLCLKCLEPATPTASGGGMPLTARVIGRDVSMHTISKNKYTAISGIKVFLKNVCTWIFTDILMQVLPAPSRANPNSSLTIPGFPHPVFGSMEVFARPSGFVLPVEGLWGWKLTHDALEDDRTVFLTFSRVGILSAHAAGFSLIVVIEKGQRCGVFSWLGLTANVPSKLWKLIFNMGICYGIQLLHCYLEVIGSNGPSGSSSPFVYSSYFFDKNLYCWHFAPTVGFLLVCFFKAIEPVHLSHALYLNFIIPMGILYSLALWHSNSAHIYPKASYAHRSFFNWIALKREQLVSNTMLNMFSISLGITSTAYGKASFDGWGVICQLGAVTSQPSRTWLVVAFFWSVINDAVTPVNLME
ncbi:hypothetical protein Nepgr_000843 [Nepenthes gracilis]|uniref:Uncharacterized protein n=1 Tax=Nepenthes gracilis TaxID=150966 RepID=A0AAD3P757_NEPGR|nr:hypothetical protein Nepgr_000843 [Nepenthes gracilis]